MPDVPAPRPAARSRRCNGIRHQPAPDRLPGTDGLKRATCRGCGCLLVQMASGRTWFRSGELGVERPARTHNAPVRAGAWAERVHPDPGPHRGTSDGKGRNRSPARPAQPTISSGSKK